MPFFYNYEKDIERCLMESGNQVYLIDTNIHAQGFLKKLAMFYTKKLRDKIVREYYEDKTKDVPLGIDTVFVIKGQWMTDEVIEMLKTRFKDARFKIYQWDSVATFSDQTRINPHFQDIYTFDPVDSENYNWNYRPLFFKREECVDTEEKKYDLIFLCSMHTRRMQILLALKKVAEGYGKKVFSYIYVPRLQYIKEAVLKRNPLYKGASGELHFASLPMKDTVDVYNHTRCFVDYTFPQQNGLSMRTIESVGHKCKLVTNNRHVLDTDFYDPDNVCIYDPDDFDIPKEFLETPYHDIAKDVYERYSLEGFLEDILCD
ncbi:hypothetical protein SAMN05216356_107127 [Oribacterium sp. WCC10]|nr:hypothetical protein SAMN05216356_107127 [Oribacterium sp. WCC10]